MSRVFTTAGAKRLHEDFDKLCTKFARENGITMQPTHLTYGEDLRFTAKFTIKANDNEAFDNMVKYFKDQGADLHKGLTFKDGRTNYKVLGTLNPSSRSKYKIAVSEPNGGTTYFAVDYLIELLKGAK